MSAKQCIDFERPIVELEDQLNELKRQYLEGRSELKNVISALAKKIYSLKRKVYSNLTPWQVTHQIARHPNRPHTMDYVRLICEDFIELHGDRSYKDDPAIIGGIARIDGCSIVIIGHQKGTTTKEKIYRNFGMSNPEGYRKAMRLMLMAERFNKPVVTLIDTPGAYPGVGAEERGQSEAIARNLMVMSRLRTPTVSVVIGEGGSGGALAIGVSDRVMMMQYATYSVISPEGCAAILWKDGNKVDTAAQSLKLTSKDLLKLGIIDQIIKEPLSLAHNDPVGASKNLKKAIISSLKELYFEDRDTLLRARYDKFRRMGVLREVT